MLPDRIKELRNERKMSQTALADALIVKQQSVSGWECGTIQPTIDTLTRMAILFDVSLDYLLGETDERRKFVEITDEDPQIIELRKIVKKMSAQGIQKVIDYADLLENSGRYPKPSLWD